MIQEEMPKLMQDSSDKDGHAETVMDYVISWCLRRAQSMCKTEKPILYSKCRYMLCKLLDIAVSDIESVEFKRVEVWKQWERIDLFVEVDAIMNKAEKQYAILIEDKFYSGLRNTTDTDGSCKNQLEVYKRKFEDYYKEQNEERELKYALITCIERGDKNFRQYEVAENFGFKVFSFYELLEDEKPTESEIFNEFWLRWGS